MGVETRYMRGDQQTINGLTAYILGTTQSNTEKKVTIGSGTTVVAASCGIRAYKGHVDGTKTEITDGVPVAVASRISGEGLDSATWDCPQTALATTDSIIIEVYGKWGTGAWVLKVTYTSEQLGATQLDSVTWTVYYYIKRTSVWQPPVTIYYAEFYWGTSTYDSKIENFSWSIAGQVYEIELDAVCESLATPAPQCTFNIAKDASVAGQGLHASETAFNILKDAVAETLATVDVEVIIGIIEIYVEAKVVAAAQVQLTFEPKVPIPPEQGNVWQGPPVPYPKFPIYLLVLIRDYLETKIEEVN